MNTTQIPATITSDAGITYTVTGTLYSYMDQTLSTLYLVPVGRRKAFMAQRSNRFPGKWVIISQSPNDREGGGLFTWDA